MAGHLSGYHDIYAAGGCVYGFIKETLVKRHNIWSSETVKTKKDRKFNMLGRASLENIASSIIGLGIFMFMQPFSLLLYSHSFKFILFGTITFIVVSHFPE